MIQVRLPTSRISPECHQMAEFRTLGTLDLRGADDHPVLSILAGSKRVALLAYLAIEGAGGFVRRDSLVGIFWPESDTEHARSSLRSALRILRRGLGDGVIIARGDEEIGVAPDALWCDVVAFQQALDAGRLEHALDLYRGELLPGFFLSDTPEFETWLDRTRERLRQQAVEAAWLVAERHEASGDAAQAERAAARAMELAADDEDVLRRQIELLDRLGNRTGALHVYDEFARRIDQESGDEPGARTRALADAIRARLEAQQSIPPILDARKEEQTRDTPAVEAGPEPEPQIVSIPVQKPAAVKPPAIPPEPGTARNAPTGLVRRYAMAAVFLLLVLSGAFLLWNRPISDDEVVSQTAVAVFPFSVRGADTLSYLGEGMAILLSTKLDGVVGLQPVDPQAVLGLTAEEQVNRLDPERAQALAQRLGAGRYVLGNILEAGGRLQLTASLYHQRGGLETTAQVEVQDESHLFDLVDRLTAQLIAGPGREPGAELTRLAASTTTSLPALKAYLQGERAFRQHRYDVARSAFQRALQADSTFALAAYRLSTVADWVDDFTNVDVAGEAIRHAARFSGRLPPTDRMLVDGLLAFLSDAPDEALRIYRTLLAQRPSNVEGWFQLAKVQYHDNPLLGLPPNESRAAFERVLQLDPEHQPARAHLAMLAARARDRSALDTILPHLLAETPEDSLRWLHLRAFAVDDANAQAHFGAMYPTLSDSLLWMFVEDLGNAVQLHGVGRIAQHLTDPGRAREARIAGHLLVGWLEIARGRPSAAKRRIAAVAQLDPAAALEYRAVFATPQFLPVPEVELRAIRDSVAAWEGTATENPYLKLYTDMWPSIRQYLLGLLSARLRDDEGVQRHLTALAPQEPTPERLRVIERRKAAIRARVAAQKGDPQTALALLRQRQFPGIPAERFNHINFFERHLRPGLLQALGRQEEALRWYGAAPWTGEAYFEETLWDVVHLAPFHLERARILDRMGRTREAASHYREFIRLWRSADPELQPLVRNAQQRLARLGDGR